MVDWNAFSLFYNINIMTLFAQKEEEFLESAEFWKLFDIMS